MTRDELIDAIAKVTPKLIKTQLSEILLLANAWSNGIPMLSPAQMLSPARELAKELQRQQQMNQVLQEEVIELSQKISELEEYSQNLGDSLRRVSKENRALKNGFFLQPKGVRADA